MMWTTERVFAAAGLIGCAVLIGCEQPTAYQEPPPPLVTVTRPIVEDVPVYLEENGESEAVAQALVRARVPGELKQILFEPDAEVAVRDPLFEIEKDQYKVALQAAKAELSSATAGVANAEAEELVAEARISAAKAQIEVANADFARNDQLLKQNAVSRNEWDSANAARKTAEAALESALAGQAKAAAMLKSAAAAEEAARSLVAQAELELGWTDVVAPIAGQVSRVLTKQGNLVEAGTELVEIVQMNPIWVNFSISEKFLLEAERDRDERPTQSLEERNIRVEVQRNGDPDFPFQGRIDFVDRKADPLTGTLPLRAEIENGDRNRRLLPGTFVRVRVQISTIEDAVLIPSRAVNRDPNGTFVYVVGEEDRVVRRPIRVGIERGDRTVVEEGLSSDQTVIVDGLQRVRPGVVVAPEWLDGEEPR